MTILTHGILSKLPVEIYFSSDEYGVASIKLAEPPPFWMPVTAGFVVEFRDFAKTKDLNDEKFTRYTARFHSLGHYCNIRNIMPDEVKVWAEENPQLICSTWNDALVEAKALTNFKRKQRPLFQFTDRWGDKHLGPVWSTAPDGRIGVFEMPVVRFWSPDEIFSSPEYEPPKTAAQHPE